LQLPTRIWPTLCTFTNTALATLTKPGTVIDHKIDFVYNTCFKICRSKAEKAIDTMAKILPSDHLLLASSKRVLALILEEVAIDMTAGLVSNDACKH
jgi:hypothetical protein